LERIDIPSAGIASRPGPAEARRGGGMNPIYRQITVIDSEATGKYMRAERELNAISLRAMAKKMRLDPSNLSKLERGKMPMTLELVKRFNKALVGKYQEIA
jgi:predicted transcriptional regulator